MLLPKSSYENCKIDSGFSVTSEVRKNVAAGNYENNFLWEKQAAMKSGRSEINKGDIERQKVKHL